jgi:hypothetical protein
MKHNANGRVDMVPDIRSPGTQEVRCQANRPGFDFRHEAIAWRDKLFTSADRRQ